MSVVGTSTWGRLAQPRQTRPTSRQWAGIETQPLAPLVLNTALVKWELMSFACCDVLSTNTTRHPALWFIARRTKLRRLFCDHQVLHGLTQSFLAVLPRLTAECERLRSEASFLSDLGTLTDCLT